MADEIPDPDQIHEKENGKEPGLGKQPVNSNGNGKPQDDPGKPIYIVPLNRPFHVRPRGYAPGNIWDPDPGDEDYKPRVLIPNWKRGRRR